MPATKTVLVVDDTAFVRDRFATALTTAGHTAVTVGTVSELLARLDLKGAAPRRLRVAYHSACSLQHGQRVREAPVALLSQAGFTLTDVPEAHLCCGSAGVYNILQSELAEALRTRKLAALASGSPQLVATGNIGCMTQIGGGTSLPVVHTVELLDWATGGPLPPAVYEAFHARYGVRVSQLYGATEIGSVTYTAVRREHNKLADRLVNEALDAEASL